MLERKFKNFAELAAAFGDKPGVTASVEQVKAHVKARTEEAEVRYPQKDIDAVQVYHNPLNQGHKRDKMKYRTRQNYGRLEDGGKIISHVPARPVHPNMSMIDACKRYVEKYGK